MQFAPVAIGAVIGLFVVGWLAVAWRRPAVAVIAILGLAVASSHLLSLLFQAGVPAVTVRSLIVIKDLLAVTLTAVLLTRALRAKDSQLRWLILPMAFLALGMVPAVVTGLGAFSLYDVVLSLRGAGLPILALLTGLLLVPAERRTAAQGALVIIALGATYALIEYFLPLSFVRDTIGVGEYWQVVKQQPYLMDPNGTGLPGNFMSSIGARRLSGSFGDPLAAGYALAAGLVLALLSRGLRWQVTTAALMSVALILAITRGGWIIVAGALIPALIRGTVSGGRRAWLTLLTGVLAGAAVIVVIPGPRDYVTGVFSGDDTSTLAHLLALARTSEYPYSAFGGGFGAAGAPIGTGTESVFITLALQLGLVGTTLYLAAFGLLLFGARRRWARASLAWPFAGLCAALLVTMLVSEQLLTFNAGWVVVLIIALAPWRDSDAGDSKQWVDHNVAVASPVAPSNLTILLPRSTDDHRDARVRHPR